jgi:signal transduction histidine kinase
VRAPCNGAPIQLEAQEVLDRQVAQLTRLVDDLLDVSRISTGRVRLRIESVDLRDAVRDAVEIVRPQIDREQQTLTLLLPDEVVGILGDGARLQQILVNLLDNANMYTDRGGLLTVELRTEGEEAVLCVRDTQADQALTRRKAGWASDSRSYNRWLACTEDESRCTAHRDKGASSS